MGSSCAVIASSQRGVGLTFHHHSNIAHEERIAERPESQLIQQHLQEQQYGLLKVLNASEVLPVPLQTRLKVGPSTAMAAPTSAANR